MAKRKQNRLTINDTVYKYPGPAGWFFVKLGEAESRLLKSLDHLPRVAWGYLPVTATLGKTTWKTTLFPSKDGPYLLALKSEVRKKEKVGEGDRVTVEVVFEEA